ncbi:hypothetical protein RFI_06663 [Reticulomyxa filosa]|uniref:Uncharacterized protein n=1 Tax=Reticulomyxa filosa TaxID=46433 RepID=X6NX48_RETFI|nr:hypothetical protein RFI_06663 [Reticulomyxa filosa]|eukprot:ETO30458.1 hypothetical protein RFI_06663 [Reticulomyxa filosa]
MIVFFIQYCNKLFNGFDNVLSNVSIVLPKLNTCAMTLKQKFMKWNPKKNCKIDEVNLYTGTKYLQDAETKALETLKPKSKKKKTNCINKKKFFNELLQYPCCFEFSINIDVKSKYHFLGIIKTFAQDVQKAKYRWKTCSLWKWRKHYILNTVICIAINCTTTICKELINA